MEACSRIMGSAGFKGCEYACIYCFTRNSSYKRNQRLDILSTQDLFNITDTTEIIQPACDSELFLLKSWKRYLNKLASIGKTISFATKSVLSDDIVKELKEIHRILVANDQILHIGVTITKLYGWEDIEPNAQSPFMRIDTLKKLWDAEIPTVVLIRPLIPTLTKNEINEIVDLTYRHCYGYLSGPLYVTQQVKEYLIDKNADSYDIKKQVAEWQEGCPQLDVIGCKSIENALIQAIGLKGGRYFKSNIEAVIFSKDVNNLVISDELKWSSPLRREQVATVYIFDPCKKEFLLIFHKKLGKWLSPGGHVEVNESIEETAIREVKEETGIDIELMNIKGKLNKDGKDYRRIETHEETKSFCIIEEFVCTKKVWDPHIHVDNIFISLVRKENSTEVQDNSENNIYDWLTLEQIKKINTFDNVACICQTIIDIFNDNPNYYQKDKLKLLSM